MDKSKSPDQRAILDGARKTAFPNLGDNYEIEGPATENYNCIAHTLGDHGNWVNPETGPPGNPLSEMDKKYEALGYKRSPGMDTSLEPGKEKVVVYATKNPDGSIKDVTHGAIQRPDGTYSSKLGAAPQIRHQTPEALNGPVYGEPVAVYEK
jgi:type VI secretion system secreted protein VgrG